MITPPLIINEQDLLISLQDCYFSPGEQRLETYKNKRGRKPSLRSVMKSKQEKEEIAEFFRNRYKEHKALEDSFRSLPYNEIEDEEYKDILINQIDTYNKEKSAFENYKHYCLENKLENSHKFYNLSFINFINAIQEIYHYEEIYSRIEYNKMHYAERDKDVVLLTSDFIQFDKQGKPTRIKYQKHYGKFYNIIDNYFRLFYLIYNKEKNKQNFQYLFWLTCNFINKTIDLNDFNISLLDVYMRCQKLYSKTSSKIQPKPIKRARLQKVFFEPGYEKEGKANYKLHKYDKIKLAIFNEFKNSQTNKIDIKKIQVGSGLYEVVTKEIIEEDVEIDGIKFGRTIKKNAELVYKAERLIKELIKEMRGDEQYKEIFEGKEIERKKSKKQDTSKRKKQDTSKRKKQDTSKRKKQDTSKRKKQDRSLWHKLVEEGKSFEEVQKEFPDLKRNAYRTYNSRMNRNVREE